MRRKKFSPREKTECLLYHICASVNLNFHKFPAASLIVVWGGKKRFARNVALRAQRRLDIISVGVGGAVEILSLVIKPSRKSHAAGDG
jgi:hypothetical protein